MDTVPLGASCAKCNCATAKTYNCDHTDYAEYCKECYTELHYYLTEPDAASGGRDAAAEAQSKPAGDLPGSDARGV